MTISIANNNIRGTMGLTPRGVQAIKNTGHPLAQNINSIRNTQQNNNHFPQTFDNNSQTGMSSFPHSQENFSAVFSPSSLITAESIENNRYIISSNIASNDAINILGKEESALAYTSLTTFVQHNNTGDSKSKAQNHNIIQSLNIMLSLLDSCKNIDIDSKNKIRSDFNKFAYDFSKSIFVRKNILARNDADKAVEKKITSLLNKYSSLKNLPALLMKDTTAIANAVNEKYVYPICRDTLKEAGFQSQNEAEAQRIVDFITDNNYASNLSRIGAVSKEAISKDNNLLSFHYFYNFFNILVDKAAMLNTFGLVKENPPGPANSVGNNLVSVSLTPASANNAAEDRNSVYMDMRANNFSRNDNNHIYESMDDNNHIYDSLDDNNHIYESMDDNNHIYESIDDNNPIYESIDDNDSIYESIDDNDSIYESIDDNDSIYDSLDELNKLTPLAQKETSTNASIGTKQRIASDPIYDVPRKGIFSALNSTNNAAKGQRTVSDPIYDIPKRWGSTPDSASNAKRGSTASESVYDVPKKGSTVSEPVYDVPRGSTASEPIYDVPKRGSAASEPTYDVPKRGSTASEPIYDVPKKWSTVSETPKNRYRPNVAISIESPAYRLNKAQSDDRVQPDELRIEQGKNSQNNQNGITQFVKQFVKKARFR